MKNKRNDIEILQDNIASIRKVAGWTLEEFGRQVGITKQALNNIELKKTPMSKPIYMTIMLILANETEINKENRLLQQVVELVTVKAKELNDEEYEELKDMIATIAFSAAGGISQKSNESNLNTMLKGLGTVGLIGAATFGAVKIMQLLFDKLNDD